MGAINYEVWKGKELSDVFRDIYKNQKATQSQITILIDSLRPLIKNAGDAAVVVPLIRDYLDVSVKNDSHIVRLAAVIERLYAAEKMPGSDGGSDTLTEEEKKQLMSTIETEIRQISTGHEDVQKKIETAQKEVKELTDGEDDEDTNEET